jgi:hypothetical protein
MIPFDDATREEYVEIGGLVLATAAWECVDFSALYDAPPVRGDDVAIPYHEGAQPFRRTIDARRVVLPMVVYGDHEREGDVSTGSRLTLRDNLDALKREVARPGQSGDGTKLLRHVFSDGEVRQAPCHVIPPLQIGAFSPSSVRCTIDVIIPGGVLRSGVRQDVVSDLASDSLVVPNGGTGDQFESLVTLAGDATVVTIRNLTWDPSGGTWIRYTGSISTGVLIDTRDWTVLSGGVNAVGRLTHAGHERWLPLLPGPNHLEIIATGGNATVRVQHYPAWL